MKNIILKIVEKYHFEERYANLLAQIQDILVAYDVLDFVTVDTKLLGLSLLNYFEDIERLKPFELIEKANTNKVYGYETFWLLRNQPIQIVRDGLPYRLLHINEKVMTAILIPKLLKEAEFDAYAQNDRLLEFMELMYYNFKYRIFTQQSLELMSSAFLRGSRFATQPRR